MAARLNAPVLGANDPQLAESHPWEASLTWRYQKSDRHFRGSNEESNRQAEHSEVRNYINLLDFGLTHYLNTRWSVSLSIPYMMAERSYPIRNDERVTIGRSQQQARAVGDVVFSAGRWMLDPVKHPNGNVRLGFGIKVPTGPNNVADRRTRYVDGEYVTTIETVDQSIQPGDGGLGATLDLGWFQRFGKSVCTMYFSGTYLFNPEGTSGVYTYRSRESESIMSVADQYLARLGVTFDLNRSHSLAFGIGGRIEGVPVYDFFGASDGFRRPGYAVSIEPSLTFSKGLHNFSVAVPVALYRNRLRSVPDRMEEGRHGDAAFADWLLLVSYSRRFGGHSASPAAAATCEDPGN